MRQSFCFFTIADREPPTVLECPDQPIIIRTQELPIPVSNLHEPTFSDNVGVVNIHVFGGMEMLEEYGEHSVLYVAYDAAENEAICEVIVDVVYKGMHVCCIVIVNELILQGI